MFFYLIKNSSFLKEETDSILFKTILYGIVMYISFHAIINCSFSNTSLFNTYFWTLFFIDIGVIYYTYQFEKNGEVTIHSNLDNTLKETNVNVDIAEPKNEINPIFNPVLDTIKKDTPFYNTLSKDNSNIKQTIKILDDVNTSEDNNDDTDVYEEVQLPDEPQSKPLPVLNDEDILSNIQNKYDINILEQKTEQIVNDKINAEQLSEIETDIETDIDINMSDFEKLLD